MEIRFARPDEVEEIATLWCDAFPGKRTIADRVRMLETGGRYGGLETVLVARDPQGRLAGACKIYRLTQYLAGVPLPMMGLAAVAVAPYARRRGLGATLCGAALSEARDRGDVLSTLYPFRPAYYERLGWGLVGRLLRHRFRTASLPLYDEAGRVRPARLPQDADAIAACYDRVASRSNGPLRRDRRIWAYRLTGTELGVLPVDEDAALAGSGRDRQRVVVCDDGGITGYAILRSVAGPTPEEGTLHVRELVAEDESAYRALLGHVAAQRDQWPLGVHFARPEERFADRLDDPRPPRSRGSRSLYFPTAGMVQGPMLRIVDVAAALGARPLFEAQGAQTQRAAVAGARSEGAATLELSVADPQLPANDGSWRLQCGPAGTLVERRSGAPHGSGAPIGSGAAGGNPDAALETDVATLARILAGEISATDAVRLGRARVTGRAELLDGAFATTESFWLPDEF